MKTISVIIVLFVIGLFWSYTPKQEPIKKPNIEAKIHQKEMYCRNLENKIIEKQTFIINNLER